MVHPHSNLIRIVDNIEIDVSSLAQRAGALGVSNIDAAKEMGFRTVVQRGIVSWVVPVAGQAGPLYISIVQVDLSLAEAEESIEADPQDSKEEPANEQSRRMNYPIGFARETEGSLGDIHSFLFDTRHKISVPEGSTLAFMAYNTSRTTALAASNSLNIYCEHLGVWLRD